MNCKAKRETELKNFFALIFCGLKHDIWPCWGHRRSPEAESGTWILPKPNKVISILTETHINHDQIHHTRNNLLGPIFFSPEGTQKECFFCFIWFLKVSLRVTMIQKRGLYPSRLLPLMRVLFVPLQGIAPESSWLGGAFFKDYKNICNLKMREMKTK